MVRQRGTIITSKLSRKQSDVDHLAMFARSNIQHDYIKKAWACKRVIIMSVLSSICINAAGQPSDSKCFKYEITKVSVSSWYEQVHKLFSL